MGGMPEALRRPPSPSPIRPYGFRGTPLSAMVTTPFQSNVGYYIGSGLALGSGCEDKRSRV
jgi:hypothetical protein